MMGRRNDHSREEIRQLALAAAEQIVAEGGYKALSARRISKAIGYTVGTLYLVFDNLDDLTFQLNGRTLDQLYRLLERHRLEGSSAVDRLCAMATVYIGFAEAESPRWNMLFEFVTEHGELLPTWYQEKLAKVFGLVEERLLEVVARAQQEEVRRAARVLWAGVHGICLLKIRQRLVFAGGQSTEEMAHMLISNFLTGMSRL